MFLFLMSYLLKTVQRYKIIINLQAFSRKISQNDSIFLYFLSFCRGFIPKSANFPHISGLSNHLSSLFRSIQLSSFIFSVYPAIFLHFFGLSSHLPSLFLLYQNKKWHEYLAVSN